MPTNCSGTITTGDTAQTLVSWAAPAPRVSGMWVQNQDATETLYVRDDGAAASADGGSVAIPPGGLYETPEWWPGKQNPDPVSVFSRKSGHVFAARWY